MGVTPPVPQSPCAAPLELGFGSPGPSVPFGPLPWRRGGLRWGFTNGGWGRWEKYPGTGKSSLFFSFLGGNEGGEGGILLAETVPLLSSLPACPQAPPAGPPFPFLSLNTRVQQQQDGLRLCRCVLGGVSPCSASPPALVLFPSSAHHRSTLTDPGVTLL